jgi:hypothetical protein
MPYWASAQNCTFREMRDIEGLLLKTKRPKLFRVGTCAEQPSPESAHDYYADTGN